MSWSVMWSVWKPGWEAELGSSTSRRTLRTRSVLSSLGLDLTFFSVLKYSSSVWLCQAMLFFSLKRLFLLALRGKEKISDQHYFHSQNSQSPAEAINTSWNSEWKSIASFSCLQWSEDYSNSISIRLHELYNECKTKLDLVR